MGPPSPTNDTHCLEPLLAGCTPTLTLMTTMPYTGADTYERQWATVGQPIPADSPWGVLSNQQGQGPTNLGRHPPLSVESSK